MFILYRRRKQICENEPSVRYENPYYAEGKSGEESDIEYEEEDELGFGDIGAVGGMDSENLKKPLVKPEQQRKTKECSGEATSSSSLLVRSVCVMNQYDAPPGKPKDQVNLLTSQADSSTSYLEENQYDEVGPRQESLSLPYDIPPNNSPVQPVLEEHPYNNDDKEENVYESLENLSREIGQLREDHTDGTAAENVIEDVNDAPGIIIDNAIDTNEPQENDSKQNAGNIYVPFPGK